MKFSDSRLRNSRGSTGSDRYFQMALNPKAPENLPIAIIAIIGQTGFLWNKASSILHNMYSQRLHGYSETLYACSKRINRYSETLYGCSKRIQGHSETIYGCSIQCMGIQKTLYGCSKTIYEHSEWQKSYLIDNNNITVLPEQAEIVEKGCWDLLYYFLSRSDPLILCNCIHMPSTMTSNCPAHGSQKA